MRRWRRDCRRKIFSTASVNNGGFQIRLAEMAATLSPSTGLIVGEAVVFLVIGAFLSYKAYVRS